MGFEATGSSTEVFLREIWYGFWGRRVHEGVVGLMGGLGTAGIILGHLSGGMATAIGALSKVYILYTL